jgi:hypothetical protein
MEHQRIVETSRYLELLAPLAELAGLELRENDWTIPRIVEITAGVDRLEVRFTIPSKVSLRNSELEPADVVIRTVKVVPDARS